MSGDADSQGLSQQPVYVPGFDVECFARHRRELGCAWGEPLDYRAVTGSTNDDALAAARAGSPAGSLFVADHQRAGRGRSGRSWLSRERAGLLFSLLLRPAGGASGHAALTLAVGLGVRAALAGEVAVPLGLKWPNDVLALGRKLAGVLCEAQVEHGRVQALVVGVGINVGELPAEVERDAVSIAGLLPAGKVAPGRELLLARAVASIERYVVQCGEEGFAALRSEFAQHDALRGRRVRVSGGTEIVGVVQGVDPEGQLLLESDGVIVAVRSGTVRVIA